MKHHNASHGYRPVHRAKLLCIAPLTPQANHGTVSVSGPRAPVTGFHRVLAARCGFPFRLRRVLRSALLSATALVAVAAPGWASEYIDNVDPEIVNGTPWNTGGVLVVGYSSTGELEIIAGGTVTNTNGTIGFSLGATGTVTVTGANSRWTNTGDILVVGNSGTGTLTIAEGGVVEATRVLVANNAASSGTLNIGAAAGDTAVAAGTLMAPTVVFDEATGKLVFNHTDTDYTFAAAISGAGSVNVLSGTTKLTGTNTYSGGTTISGGTLQIGNGGTSGSLSGDVTNNSALAFNRSNASSYGGDLSGTGSLTKSGAGTLTLTGASSHTGGTTISAGTLQIGDGGTTGSLSGDITNNGALAFNRSDALTFGDDISGTGSLTKSGTGTLTLTGTSSHTGGTTISGGTLQIGNGGTTGSLSGDVTNNGALAFNRSDALTFGNDISGTGSLTKSGAETLTLTGTNSYTGGTTISAGTLQIGNGGTTGSLSGNVTNHSALAFNRSDAFTFGNDISGTGSLIKSGAETLTLTGTNTYSGGTTISAGTLQVGNGGTTGSLSGDVTNNGALAFNRSDALTYGDDLSGTGSLTKSGAGTLTLTGASSHTGGTTVSAGKLVVNGSTGTITLNGGTLGGSGTVGTVAVNSGSTIAPGNSIGTIAAGNTVFNAGSSYAVEVNADGDSDLLNATGTVTINAGATLKIASETTGKDGSTYARSTDYTIIKASSGVTGTFDTVSDSFAFLDAKVSYDPNKVNLKLTRNDVALEDLAITSNQVATANAVDSLGSGSALYDAVVALEDDKVEEAYDSMSGEAHASAKSVLFQNDAAIAGSILGHMRDTSRTGLAPAVTRGIPAPSRDTWGTVFGFQAKTEETTDAATMERSGGGALAGVNLMTSPDLQLGVTLGVSRSEYDITGRQSSGTATAAHLGIYGSTQRGPLNLRFGATYGYHEIDSERRVTVGATTDHLSASYKAQSATLFAEASYSVAQFEPFINACPSSGFLAPMAA